MQRWIVAHLSFWAICLVLRAWGHRLISTERARALNTAIMAWAVRVVAPTNQSGMPR